MRIVDELNRMRRTIDYNYCDLKVYDGQGLDRSWTQFIEEEVLLEQPGDAKEVLDYIQMQEERIQTQVE